MRLGLAVATAGVLLTGCAAVIPGDAVAGDPSKAVQPIAATALDPLLLTVDQVNTTLSAVGMTVSKSYDALGRLTVNISDAACSAIASPVEESVYTNSGWTAVREQILKEPVQDYGHLVDQAVISFPTANDAVSFFTRSQNTWADCAEHHRFTRHSTSDKADYVWTVGPVSSSGGMLTNVKTQEGGYGWMCQRALTTASNLVVDVAACDYSSNPVGAVAIAQKIAAAIDKPK